MPQYDHKSTNIIPPIKKLGGPIQSRQCQNDICQCENQHYIDLKPVANDLQIHTCALRETNW